MALAWDFELDDDQGDDGLARMAWITGIGQGPTLAERLGRCRPAWFARAACAGMDPEMFFPEQGGSVTEAKAVCAACPVRVQCGQLAAGNHERFGIWGGLGTGERRAQRRAG